MKRARPDVFQESWIGTSPPDFQRQAINHIHFKRNFDTVSQYADLVDEHQKRRSSIREVLYTRGHAISLSETGVAAVFDLETGNFQFLLNLSRDEFVKNMHLNKFGNSLICLKTKISEHYTTLTADSLNLIYLDQKLPNNARRLFASESLRYPGFMEFDESSPYALTVDKSSWTAKMWSLTDYSVVGSFSMRGVENVKLTGERCLIVYQNYDFNVMFSFSVASVDESGFTIKKYTIPIHVRHPLPFIELACDSFFIHIRTKTLAIYNMAHNSLKLPRCGGQFSDPESFLYLHQSHQFLFIYSNRYETWTTGGDLIHRVMFPDHSCPMIGMNISLNRSQRFLAMCFFDLNFSSQETACVIRIYEIDTGECLKVIQADAEDPDSINALMDVSSINFYDDDCHLITGNSYGAIGIWSM